MASPQISHIAAQAMLMGLAHNDPNSYGAMIAGMAVAIEAPEFWVRVLAAAYEDAQDEYARLIHRAEQVTATVKDAVRA